MLLSEQSDSERNQTVKRITLILIVLLALPLAGCASLGIGADPTAVPTYTPYPTYTPFPTPSPLPPTEVPTETPEPVETAVLATATPSLPQVTLAFSSNLREGPGTEYPVITRLEAGEILNVLGRNQLGNWLLTQTADGTEGWMMITQLVQPVNPSQFSLAEGIPTADPARVTPTTPPASTSAPVADQPDSEDDFLISMNVGDVEVCKKFSWVTNQAFAVSAANQAFAPFNTLNPNSVINATPAFRASFTNLPANTLAYIKGNVVATDCGTNTCTMLTFTVCGQAQSNAKPGGFIYQGFVNMQIGDQVYSSLYETATLSMPLNFQIND